MLEIVFPNSENKKFTRESMHSDNPSVEGDSKRGRFGKILPFAMIFPERLALIYYSEKKRVVSRGTRVVSYSMHIEHNLEHSDKTSSKRTQAS